MGTAIRRDKPSDGVYVEPRQAKAERNTPENVEAVADRLYRIVSNALTGPTGLHSQTLVAAVGALAGYGARWLSRRAMPAQGEIAFQRPAASNTPYVSTSETAELLVVSMSNGSFASALVSRLIPAGAGWLPDVDTSLAHNFRGVNDPDFPDYTVSPEYWPQCSLASLLIMFWERTRREITVLELTDQGVMQAFGLAAASAALYHAKDVPPAIAAQLSIETAIAASRLDYGF